MAPPTDSLASRGNDALDPEPHQSLERSDSLLGGLLTERTFEARQATNGIIPSYYLIDGPSPGTVIGIVLGSVVGFILVAYLLFTLIQGNPRANGTSRSIRGEEEFVVRRPRRKSNAGRSRRSSRGEEYSRSPRQSGGRSTVIVEERRSAPRPRSRSRSIVMESRRPGDDIVEVIEEHDDYSSRRSSHRGPGYR